MKASSKWNDCQSRLIRRGFDPTRLGEAAQTDFLRACHEGDLKLVRAYVECGVAVDCHEEGTEFTPLIKATQGNHLPVINLLIEAGADLDGRESRGYTPIYFAIFDKHYDALVTLLVAGASHDVACNTGWCALTFASNSGRVDLADALLEAGADPNLGVESLQPPLLYVKDDAAMCARLLKGGADPKSLVRNDGYTLLMHACWMGYEEIAALLLEAGAEVGRTNEFGWDAWMFASSNHHVSLAQWLVDFHGASVRDLAFLRFTANGALGVRDEDLGRFQMYLRQGGDPNVRTSGGWTLLIYAAGCARVPLFELLLEAGAELAATSGTGWTALTQAARFGHLSMVERLLEMGVPVDQRPEHSSALVCATKAGHTEIVARLIEAGASVDSIDDDHMTALMYAADTGDIATLDRLIQRGADLDTAMPDGVTALMLAARGNHVEVVRRLVEAGADLERRSAALDTTVLHQICAAEQATPEGLEILEILVEAGADLMALNKAGFTALELARSEQKEDYAALFVESLTAKPLAELMARHEVFGESLPHELYPELCERQTTLSLLEWIRAGQSELVIGMLEVGVYDGLEPLPRRHPLIEAAQLRNCDVVRALLKAGADPNTTDARGATPLWVAARLGDLKVVAVLLEAGAIADGAPSSELDSPLTVAAQFNHTDCMQRLYEAGARLELGPAGNSPVFWAAFEGWSHMLVWLLARGASTEIPSRHGLPDEAPLARKALEVAREHGFDAIVDILLNAGAVVDVEHDELTVDSAEARERLSEFQLPEPIHYVLEFVKVAHSLEATKIDIRIDADEFEMRFDGVALTPQQLERVYSAPSSPRAGVGEVALRHLAIGAQAAHSIGLSELLVEFDAEQGDGAYAFRLVGDEVEQAGVKGSNEGGARIYLRERIRPDHMLRFVDRLRGQLPKVELLKERCGFSEIPIRVNGKPIKKVISLPDYPFAPINFDQGSARGRLGVMLRHKEVTMHVVHHGVLVTTHRSLGAHVGAGVIVHSPRLTLDPTQSTIVEDAAWTATQAVVEYATLASLAACLGDLSVPNVQTEREVLLDVVLPILREIDPADRRKRSVASLLKVIETMPVFCLATATDPEQPDKLWSIADARGRDSGSDRTDLLYATRAFEVEASQRHNDRPILLLPAGFGDHGPLIFGHFADECRDMTAVLVPSERRPKRLDS